MFNFLSIYDSLWIWNNLCIQDHNSATPTESKIGNIDLANIMWLLQSQ